MKAAVLERIGDPFVVQEIDIDDPIGREVLVDVKGSGLCHSDLHLQHMDIGRPFPAVLGHEVAGIVTAVGPDVTSLRVGDHIVGSLIGYCGNCVRCLVGNISECLNPEAVRRAPGERPRLSRNGEPIFQTDDLAGFAEQVLVHENNAVKIPDEIPFDKAALLACGVITGAGAVINTARIGFGGTVAVIGCGGIGLNAVQGARIAGAVQIIAIDIADDKLELAQRFGATAVINGGSDDVLARVLELTDGQGVDAAFEAIGLKATAQQAISLTKQGGGAYMIGLQKLGTKIELDAWDDLIYRYRSVKGVHMGSSNSKVDIPVFAQLYLQGRLNLDDLVSQTISLDEIDKGYEDLLAGGVARSVITF